MTFATVRFSGGPLYWRKGHRGRTMLVGVQVEEVHVVGLLRRPPAPGPLRRQLVWRSGTYRRAAPDRFRWVGWDGTRAERRP